MKPEPPALSRQRSPLLPVILITASGTLTLGGYEMVRSAAASIFLNHYSADRLPEVLMLVPPTMFLLTWIFSVVLRRIGPGATYLSTLVLSGLVLIAATEAVYNRVPGAPYLLYVFAQAYIVLIVEQVWAFINSRIRPGEGKRWNGPIIAASTLGSISGGLVTGRLSVALGSERLVIIAAVLTAASAVLGWLAFRIPGPRPRPQKTEPGRFSDHFAWDLLRRDPTIRRLAWMVMAQQAVSVLLDIAFHRALQQAMPLQDPRTAFLGYFWAGVNLFSLVLQLGVCPWLLSRTALRKVHASIPLLYGSVALAAVFFPLLSILGAAFFLSKTVDYSVFRAAKEVLYIPLSFQARYRAKMTVDALIYRSTKGVVSGALAIAGRTLGFLPLRFYPLLAVMVCAGWNRSTRGLPEPAAGSDSD
ncbi:MAG: hypothetical protein JXA62_09360 [Candidatus Aminicenantes bacterium]|nr:hypothetical protein [Candidatus Aminicenantes bacterium]